MSQFQQWGDRHNRQSKTRWLKLGLGFGGVLSIAGLAGAQWMGQQLSQQLSQQLNNQLLPEIAAELETAIDRPVQLGKVQQLTPLGLRLGPSSIPATASDSDRIQIKAIDIKFDWKDALWNHQLKLDVVLIEPQIYLEQNAEGDWIETSLDLQAGDLIEVEKVRLKDAKFALVPFLSDRTSDVDRQKSAVILKPMQGLLQLKNDEQLIVDLGGPFRQGHWNLKGQANLNTEAVNLVLSAHNMELAPLVSLLALPVQVQQGKMSGRLQIAHSRHQPIALQGVATLKQGALRAEGEPNLISDIAGTLRFQGQQIQVEKAHLRFGKIPFDLGGTIDLQQGLDLRATVQYVSAADFMQTFQLDVPFAVAGALKSNDVRVKGAFHHVIFSGTAEAAQPLQLDRLTIPTAQAQFSLDKTTDRLMLKQVEFLPDSGGKIVANANITLENEQAPLQVTVQAKQLSADALVKLYGLSDRLPALLTSLGKAESLGKINAEVNVAGTGDRPKIQADWQLQGSYPAQGKVVWVDDRLTVPETTLKIANGTITASGQMANSQWQAQVQSTPLHWADGTVQVQGQLIDQAWTAQIQGSQVGLKVINPALGVLDGEVELAGTLNRLSLNAIDATGNVQLSPTQILPRLTANFQWDGDRFHLLKAGTPNSHVSGAMALDFTGTQPAIQAMDLVVQANEDLSTLLPALQAAQIASSANLSGLARFTGRLTGSPTEPRLNGQLQIDRLALNQFQFEPSLAGAVQFTAAGLQLDLKGQKDRIQGWVDRPFQTVAVQLQANQATLQGRYQQGRLTGTVSQLPLRSVYQLAQIPAEQQWMDGLLSGQFNFGLSDNPQGVAQIRVTQPAIGTFQSRQQQGHEQDQLTGTLQYRDRLATLQDGQFQFSDSLYRFNGQVSMVNDSPLNAEISVDEGKIHDLHQMLTAVQHPDPNMATSLGHLASLQGQFAAKAVLSGSLRSGISTRFEMQGQDWVWQQYSIQKITATGQYDGQQLELYPLQLQGLAYVNHQGQLTQNPAAQIQLTGKYGSASKTGQIQLTHLPIAAVPKWMNTDVDIKGELNAAATVTGKFNEMAIAGEIKLNQLQVKKIALPETQLGFQYQGDRLKITSLETDTAPHLASAPHPVDPGSTGAEKLYFAVSAIDFTLPVETLRTYVESGEIKAPLGFYAQFLDEQALQDMRSALQYPVDVSHIDLAGILNSSTGEAWLSWLGEFIQTKAGENGKGAIETALIKAAKAKPQTVTIMDVLGHFPIRKVRVNTSAVIKLLEP